MKAWKIPKPMLRAIANIKATIQPIRDIHCQNFVWKIKNNWTKQQYREKCKGF